MGTEINDDTNEDEYHVVSVEEADPPEDILAGNWYRYVIGKGKSKIEGFKPGSMKSVTEHAKNIAEDINERATAFGRPAYYRATQKRK